MMDELLAGAAAASRLSDRRSLWAAVRLVAARLAREQAATRASLQGTEQQERGAQEQRPSSLVPDAPVLDFGELRRLAEMEQQQKQGLLIQGQLPDAVRMAGGAMLFVSHENVWSPTGAKEQEEAAAGLGGDDDLVPQAARPSLAGTMRLVSPWRFLRSSKQHGKPTAALVRTHVVFVDTESGPSRCCT